MKINLAWRGLVPGAEPLEAQKVEEHPEVVEVAEAAEMTSEDTHGGREATGQVEDSPPMEAPGEEEFPEASGQGEGSSGASGGGDSEGSPESSESSGGASGSEEAEGESSSASEGEGSAADAEGGEGKETADGESSGDGEEGVEGSPASNADTDADEGGDGAGEPGTAECGVALEEDPEGELEGEVAELEEGELEPGEGEAEEPGERNAYSWEFAPAVAMRGLQLAFARLIEAVAEDRAQPDPYGDEEWDPEALMLREWTGRPLSACRRGWHRESLILVLDSSGSCEAQAEFYSRLAQLAAKTGAVELWDAPNGELSERYHKGRWEPVEREGREPWPWKGRTILFFGDFDGGDYPIEASWGNEVFWFSPEDRYQDTLEHSWCRLPLRSFRGKYFPVRDEGEFIEAIRRLR